MTDPRICLDGEKRVYPRLEAERMKVGAQFIENSGTVYEITQHNPTRCCIAATKFGDYNISHISFEPYYGGGGPRLDGQKL